MNRSLGSRRLLVAGLVLHTFLAARLWAADETAAGQKLFLWKATSDKTAIYLLGSMHIAKPDIYPLDPKIEKAFADADTLAVEANVLNNPAELAQKLQAKSLYPEGDSLDKHVAKDVFDAVVTRVTGYGIAREKVVQTRPWFLCMLITLVELQKLGVVPQNGIDIHFLKQAGDKKSIVELEGAEKQIELLAGLAEAEQEQFLKFTEKDLANMAAHFDELTAAWSRGDADKVDTLLRKAVRDNPEFQPVFKKFFDDRNKEIAAKIEEMLKAGRSCFVVVGAGHLVGDTGIVKLLGKNYKVEQIAR